MSKTKSVKLREINRKEILTPEELLFMITVSYKKLKSSVYYDSSNMFLREKIAKYEAINLENKLAKLRDKLMCDLDDNHIDEIITNIKYNSVPKKISEKSDSPSKVITNHLVKEEYEVTKLSFFIDLQIEGHILGVLWILLTGKNLEDTYSDVSYGSILDDGYDVSQIKLFRPYYRQYTKWRDNAVKTVESMVNSGKEALLISLDIKEYYYNANVDFDELRLQMNLKEADLKSEFGEFRRKKLVYKLTGMIEQIYIRYSEVMLGNRDQIIIPIGFLPSTIIGNWYLRKFDTMIKTKLQPLYYGRYVDDLLFVIHKQEDKIYKSNSDIMEEYFVNRGILNNGVVFSNLYNIENKYIDLNRNLNIYDFTKIVTEIKEKSKEMNTITIEKFTISFRDKLLAFFEENKEKNKEENKELFSEIIANDDQFKISSIIRGGIFLSNFLQKFDNFNDEELNMFKREISEIIIDEIEKKRLSASQVYSMSNYEKPLYIQDEKIKIYSLSHKGSSAIINNFKRELQENASVFRFLPEKSEVVESFDKEIYELEYSGSVNKLGSIDGFKLNKYNLSKYLARIIYSDKFDDEKYLDETDKQLLALFDNNYCIELYSLWEKVLVYFLINSKKTMAQIFLGNIIRSMEELTVKIDQFQTYKLSDDIKIIEEKLKIDLILHLRIVMGMIDSLDNKFWNYGTDNINGVIDSLFYDIEDETILNAIYSEFIYVRQTAIEFKSSNMLRHSYVIDALANYTNLINNNDSLKVIGLESLNLTNPNSYDNKDYRGFKCNLKNTSYLETVSGKATSSNSDHICNPLCCEENNNCPFSISEKAMEYSPRFVHLHECILYFLNLKIAQGEQINGIDYLINAHNLFNRINFTTSYNGDIDERYCYEFEESQDFVDKPLYDFLNADKYFEKYPFNKNDYLNTQSDYNVNYINVGKNSTKKKLKVALIHMEINPSDISSSFLNTPNLNSKRLENIYRLLNDAVKKEAELVVFPEVSIPYYWLSAIANYSRQHNIAIICGLEHIVYENNEIYNYMATILPAKREYSSSIIKLRLKNHYSPREKKFVSGYIREEPDGEIKKEYDLFSWNGISFSVYNCFELANIKDRALFMSHVDMLVGLVHNKDINYYASIIDSLSRDIHCYFVQVNNSRYGDTRITRPSSTMSRNIIQVTGGSSDTVLTANIDINALRNFQILGYDLQTESTEFKPTPPEFNSKNVKVRMRLPLP